MFAADYPFLDVLWTMIIFFVWILWFWLLFTVFVDIFRRHDLSGWGKDGWLIFCIILPCRVVFEYPIPQHKEVPNRNLATPRAQQAHFARPVREAAGSGGATAEIAK